MHRLAHNLCMLGEKAYINTSFKNPKWLGEFAGGISFEIDKTVIVYPEISIGNPINAKNVVRWILNEVGIVGGDSSSWGSNDIAFVYADYFSGKEKNRVSGELRAFDMMLDYWKDFGLNREGECYVVRKGKNKILDRHCLGSANIENYTNEIALEMFNTKKRFICYDSECFLAVQAALCGCEVIVIPKDGIDEKSWREKFPYFKYGIAYGENNIDYAKETLHLVKDHMRYLENESIELTKNFIKICEEKFL